MRPELFIGVMLCALASAVSASRPLICYWEGWSIYRGDPYRGDPSQVPVDKCTHIIYSFLGLDRSTNKVKYLDPWGDLNKGGIRKFVALKHRRSDLKVTFAIGGWTEGSTSYSAMASTSHGRNTFARSVAEIIQKHGFDGVDLDWEYPAQRGGSGADKNNFVLLLAAMRRAIGRNKLLTIAVSANVGTLGNSYDIRAISRIVDYIHVMTYDFRGPWDRRTGNHVLLHRRRSDPPNMAQLNVADGMAAWRNGGAPPSKLIMGIGFYGKSFTLANAGNTAVGAPSNGGGMPGPWSKASGTLFYFEICKYIRESGWTARWDSEGEVPYAFRGNQWVGYDDARGIQRKVQLLKHSGYGGAMVWAVGTDDMIGACGQGRYPLLAALSRNLRQTDGENVADEDELNPIFNSTAGLTHSFSSSAQPVHSLPIYVVTERCQRSTYPHAESCRKFYLCTGSDSLRLIEQSCAEGLVFNEASGMCDFAFNTSPMPANCTDFSAFSSSDEQQDEED